MKPSNLTLLLISILAAIVLIPAYLLLSINTMFVDINFFLKWIINFILMIGILIIFFAVMLFVYSLFKQVKIYFYYKKGKRLYESGNFEKAIDYFEYSCRGGKARACSILAYMYDFGKGANQNFVKARNLYEFSCNSNDAISCNNLGNLYENGLGIKINKQKAIFYYSKACELGYEVGCENLSRIKESKNQRIKESKNQRKNEIVE